MTRSLVPVYSRMRLIPSIAAILVIATGLALGNWQLNRAAEKLALQTTLEARASLPAINLNSLNAKEISDPDLKYRKAKAIGKYITDGQIYIDNRSMGDEVGYYVLTPLKLDNTVVMVNRGFIKKDPLHQSVPEVSVPVDPIQVEGELSPGKTRFFELSGETVQGKIWQNFKPDAYSKLIGYPLAPWVLNSNAPPAGLKIVKDQPDLGIDTHRGYAFQWFALTAATLSIYVYFTFIKKPVATS
jgi:surfeit locus 1 family protein